MNSFKTDAPSAEILKKYPQLNSDFPQSFLQHMFPRIEASTLEPVENPVNPQLEWNPPGHGDIYTAFATSGILDQLLKKGYLYAFVSNIDNLGATLNKNILGYFAKNKISFLMEVTNRTWMDRKGGHIAKRKNGKFVLREASQCPPTDSSFFKDISRHSFFNTNNLWINLQDLKGLLDKKNNVLDLPMIRNRKKLDPLDENSADVFQLESAMGTAISIFDNATALYVPRSRFAPVKSCEELLLLWSDYFVLNDNFEIIHNQNRKSQQVNINLDPQFYSRIDQLEERFPNSAPSLLDCDSFKISGDVKFGKNITIKNSVEITNNKNIQAKIADNSFIDNDILFE
jgi:UTP--glucose-1-phosphate uridylyltransferase